jgi:hypothetical protein
MAGLLTHVLVGLVGFTIFSLAFKNFRYGLAFILGQFISDFISFGITGLNQGSVNPTIIMTNPWFQHLATFGHNAVNWAIITIVFLLILFLIYKFGKMEKATFTKWFLFAILFLVGIALHLILDVLIIEKSYWV